MRLFMAVRRGMLSGPVVSVSVMSPEIIGPL